MVIRPRVKWVSPAAILLSVAPRPQPRQHGGEVFGADVKVLAHPSPQHGRGDVAAAAFLLRLVQDPEDHALLAREAVAHIGQEIADVFQDGSGAPGRTPPPPVRSPIEPASTRAASRPFAHWPGGRKARFRA